MCSIDHQCHFADASYSVRILNTRFLVSDVVNQDDRGEETRRELCSSQRSPVRVREIRPLYENFTTTPQRLDYTLTHLKTQNDKIIIKRAAWLQSRAGKAAYPGRSYHRVSRRLPRESRPRFAAKEIAYRREP